MCTPFPPPPSPAPSLSSESSPRPQQVEELPDYSKLATAEDGMAEDAAKDMFGTTIVGNSNVPFSEFHHKVKFKLLLQNKEFFI